MEKVKNKISKKWILLIISCVVAFLFVIGGLNKPHLSTFTDHVAFDGVTSAAFSSTEGVVVDTKQKRMLILDENNHLTQVVDVSKSGSLINRITGVTLYNQKIYVMGALTTAGNYYNEEKVLVYDLKGNVIETLYSQTYDDAEYITTPQMKIIQAGPDFKRLAVVEHHAFKLIDFETGEVLQSLSLPENIVQISSGKNQDIFLCMGISGTEWSIDLKTQKIQALHLNVLREHMDQSVLNAMDQSSLVYDLCRLSVSPVVNSNGQIEAKTAVVNQSNSLIVLTNQDETIREMNQAPYDSFFALWTFCYWISLYWLILFVLGLIIWLMIKKLSTKGRIVIFIVFGILLSSGFYTYNGFHTAEKESQSRLTAQSKQISILLSEYFSLAKGMNIDEVMSNAYYSDFQDTKIIESFQETLKECCDANGKDKGIFARIWMIEKDGNWVTLTDSKGAYPSGQDYTDEEMINHITTCIEDGQGYFRAERNDSVCLYGCEYIRDKVGTPYAVIVSGCSMDTMIANYSSAAVDLFVNLTAIFIAIFISFSACASLKKDFKIYREMKAKNIPGKEVMFNGSWQVVYKLMTSMDMAIQVYVAQSLCVGVSAAQMAILVALPSTAFSIGMWIGTLVAPTLMIKMGNRKLSLLGCIGSLAALVLTIFSIGVSSIYLYSASKLIFGAFSQGILFVLGDNIPFLTKDEGARKDCIVSSQQAQTAAIVIATLIGGYVSQYVSYTMMYIIAAMFAVLLIPVCIGVFSNSIVNGGKNKVEQRKSTKESWKIFIKPVMLMYIITFLTPKVLLTGYSTYLFPLYSAGAGISVVLLSNISVFSKAFSYVINTPLNRFANRFNLVSVMVSATFIICVSLVCFLISPNIWWAIAVLFISTALTQVTNVGNSMYVADYAEECGQEAGVVRANTMIIQSALYVVRTPVLSAFISLGNDLACAVVGLVCGTLTGIFGIFNKIRNKKITEESSK